jgi:membrane-associated phospholipid phosphatase
MGTAALIAVSAVAGRYHYAVDVIAGAAVGAAAVLVV